MEGPRFHTSRSEEKGNSNRVDGAETGDSPGMPTEEARPVRLPLNSSSSLESGKPEERSRRRREAERYRGRSKAGGTEGKSSQAGGDRKVAEWSPLHQHAHHSKKANRVSSGSPSWDRKAGAEGPSTPGRSRTRSSADQHDQPADQALAVPKFGDWNENDPTSGDGYTDIFDKVREEKNNAKKAPMIITDPEYYPDYGARKSSKGCSCFGWFRR